MKTKILNYKTFISILLLLIFYAVGVWGMVWSDDPSEFIKLTPMNLLITIFIVLYNHKNWDSRFTLTLFLVFVAGYFIEVLGTNTGLIFGDYTYGKTLGWALFNTPLMIGINWVLLSYGSVNFINLFALNKWNIYLKSLFSATVLLLLDILIEPVAIQTDMWKWTEAAIPFQNYLAWWFIAFLFNFVLLKSIKNKPVNNVAVCALVLQFLFFVILNLLIL